eukprot:NODE_104_length_19294_cov_0.449179.p13 type:complete len:188 gc:universal NODE_104_length_19294_cov_0.449179:15173-15736(+)
MSDEKLKASSVVSYCLGGINFTLIDMSEGLCRPNSIVRFYTKSNLMWNELKPILRSFAPSEYPQEINFVMPDYTSSSCRIRPYVIPDFENQILQELNFLVETEFKIDIKKKRILMPLSYSWLYKEFGDHPNEMIITICERLPSNPFSTILLNNDVLRYENAKLSRISRKWNIKFFKETQFSCKFIYL